MKKFFNNFKHVFIDNKIFLALFTLSIVALLPWILAFWPANMSPDSLTQWVQATTFRYTDLHPYIFSVFVSFLAAIWKSPASLIIFQILVFSITIAYFFQSLLKKSANKFLVYASFALLVTFIPIDLYNVTFWSDVLYSYLIMLVSLIFVKQCFDHAEGKKPTVKSLIYVAFLILMIAFFRHNGILYVLLFPVIYYLYKLIDLKKALIVLSVLVAVTLLQMTLFSHLLNVSNDSALLQEIPKAKVIGLALKDGVSYDKNDKDFLLRLAPASTWSNYVCYNDYSLFWDNNFDKTYLSKPSSLTEWNHIFWETVLHRPDILVKDRACLDFNLLGGQNLYFLGITKNQVGLTQTPPSISINKVMTGLVNWSFEKPQRYLIWTPGIFVLIYFAFAVYSLKKKLYFSLGYVILNLANAIPILVIVSSAEYRYLYSIIPSLFLLPAIISAESLLRQRKNKEKVING